MSVIRSGTQRNLVGELSFFGIDSSGNTATLQNGYQKKKSIKQNATGQQYSILTIGAGHGQTEAND